MNVVLRDQAQGKVVDGGLFYDGERDGLGDHFADCVFEDLRAMESQSVSYEVVFGLHRNLVTRFPYTIYFLADRLPSSYS